MAEALHWVFLWNFRKENISHFQWDKPSEKAPPQEKVDVAFLGLRHSKRLAASFMPFQIDTEENLSRRRRASANAFEGPKLCRYFVYNYLKLLKTIFCRLKNN